MLPRQSLQAQYRVLFHIVCSSTSLRWRTTCVGLPHNMAPEEPLHFRIGAVLTERTPYLSEMMGKFRAWDWRQCSRLPTSRSLSSVSSRTRESCGRWDRVRTTDVRSTQRSDETLRSVTTVRWMTRIGSLGARGFRASDFLDMYPAAICRDRRRSCGLAACSARRLSDRTNPSAP